MSVSKSIKLLGVTLDDKLRFESHLCTVAASVASKTGFLRKFRSTLGNSVLKTFFAFILPSFEYCVPIWTYAAECHLRLLERGLNGIKFIIPDLEFNLWMLGPIV